MNELTTKELCEVSGGGWKAFGSAFKGTMKVAWAPVRAAGGDSIGAGMQFVSGVKDIKWACDNPNK